MTKLDLWNFALAQIPHDKRVLAEDEQSIEAERCRMFWDVSRVKVLSIHNWTFATRRVDCAAGLHVTALGHSFTYPRPSDALKVIGIFDARGRQINCSGYNGMLYADEAFARLKYIVDIEEPSDMPLLVQIAIGWDLAVQIAPLITGGGVRIRQIAQQAQNALADAKLTDTESVQGGGQPDTHYADARN